MRLLSVKRELEQLKVIARLRRGSSCDCQYVEVMDGQETTTEQQRMLENNSACYERNHNRESHVGWSSIVIPANTQLRQTLN